MVWNLCNVLALLAAILLIAAVPLLRFYFHARWLWATAPVWGTLLVLLALAVFVISQILRSGIDIG